MSLLRVSNRLSKVLRSPRNVRSMSDYTPVKEPHMNDIPVPHEPFEVGYKKRQVGNNFVLISGIAFFSFSLFFVLNSGVIVPNLTPPRKNPE
ncbi:deltameth_res domain-containing protein [Trichonephila inaurata madagascariensis]|uniref:Deltameth_res domain-containing protein n=1 Tax=Trichonephila inaurata madagascariensis TaxID=2747483 RepID=A0A8X6J2F3_9ARAC|nr:deltameth_res domain-containing protein [Trichonephila inaurata madagascariensis]